MPKRDPTQYTRIELPKVGREEVLREHPSLGWAGRWALDYTNKNNQEKQGITEYNYEGR